jgi:hypothetical protein
MGDFRIAKVMSVERRGHALNLLFMDNLAQVPMVQVMGEAMSSKAGRYLLHKPTKPASKSDPKLTKDQDVYAVVGTVCGAPMVFGFMTPQVSQMMFDRDNFLIDRHPSDTYTTLDDAGNLVVRHPSGTTVLIAEDPDPEDLTGLDFDEKFKIERNTERHVHVRILVKDGGVQKADLHIDPSGNLTVDLAGEATVHVTGDATVHVEGNTTADLDGDLALTVGGDITSSASSWSHTGDLSVDGDIDATGTITGTTDVVAGTKHLKAHVHVDPQGGSTAAPT